MSDTWPHRWEQLVRYRFIEMIALWEGRLTTRHLCDTFHIGRQQASKDINTYKRSVGPGNLAYDKFLKGYVPSEHFIPRVTRGLAEEYLGMLAQQSELANLLGHLPLPKSHVEILQPPARQLSPALLRPIISAARHCQRVEVDYVSLNHPNREGRIIVPHSLVWTGLRWHLRGWCEKNQDYRDFVLSRFRGEADILGDSVHGADADTQWNTVVDLILQPDPRLTPAQQEVVATDFAMDASTLRIRVRGRLVPYLLQLMNIQPDPQAMDPRAQQIVIANPEELKDWLIR